MEIFLVLTITALLAVFIVDCATKRKAFLARQKLRN
jgi:hypothetical protein